MGTFNWTRARLRDWNPKPDGCWGKPSFQKNLHFSGCSPHRLFRSMHADFSIGNLTRQVQEGGEGGRGGVVSNDHHVRMFEGEGRRDGVGGWGEGEKRNSLVAVPLSFD